MKYPRFSHFTFHVSRCLVILAFAAILLIPQASAQVVDIPDPNLRQAVREALDLSDEIALTQAQMLRLKVLEAKYAEIQDLTGLEYATNLKSLVLSVNNIQDITPLAGLIKLEVLGLRRNPITDLTPLANLTNLTYIHLGNVKLSDITPLANLTKLKEALLNNMQLQDITPLANLTQLIALSLAKNQIVDISALANLTQLEELWLNNNQIVDVTPLANLTQLTNLTIANNAITDFRPLLGLNLQSVDVDIHTLQELASGTVKIPDPNLERAIREAMGLPSEITITQLVMSQLIELEARYKQIADLTGLEYATNLESLVLSVNNIQDITPLAGLINLEFLILRKNPITNLTPLANLTNLTYIHLGSITLSDKTPIDITPLANLTKLKKALLGFMRLRDITPLANLTQLVCLTLDHNHIVDITPLANLTQLEELWLNNNRIVDVSPLANLTQLEELYIERNRISDFSPLQGLSLPNFTYDEVCVLPDPPFQDRIQNRNLPSTFQTWGDEAVNLPHLSLDERLPYYDLYWHNLPFSVHFAPTPQGYQPAGYMERAIANREELLAKNPNMIFLAEIKLIAATYKHYPEDFPYWLKDENGNPIFGTKDPRLDKYFLDFRIPGMQDVIVQQAIAVAKCGLYDGIIFDSWWEKGRGLQPFFGETLQSPTTAEQEREALHSILTRIRANVPEDFLILCNVNQFKMPLSAPYINGGFMEINRDHEGNYKGTLDALEDTILWYEETAREPQIVCLRPAGLPTEPPDSPTNKRWMRFFTTMSLTLSDGYVLYTTGHFFQEHFWYPFWDTDLGQPISPTVQRYQNVPSLYIREFTNGWAVYNRSGSAQTITLPASTTPVSGRENNAASTTHLLPDLDGEIYLKAPNPADVNRDGKINVLDLVQVANNFGKSAPDPNGDGEVNILDLVFVAQQFSQ